MHFYRNLSTQNKNLDNLNILTDSGNEPNFPRSDEMDPPGTNSNRIFRDSSSLAVPKYLLKKYKATTVRQPAKKNSDNSNE